MTFEEWYEENFGAVEPGVPFHLPVLKFAYESGAKKRKWVGLHEHELQVLEYNDPSGERLKLAKAVEAKLKEKNNG
jgi:hypothetical protein